MGVHYPAEPDFNAEPDEPVHAPHSRQYLVYAGVIASLLALLVILLINM
ncbi:MULTISPECIES: hypothetical protein [unclassified Gordonia (in: high G+C Gram-positive bacteria)]